MPDISDIAGKVTIRVEADLQPLEEGLAKAKRETQDFDREVAGSFKEAAVAGREFGNEVKGSVAGIATGLNEAAQSADKFTSTVKGSAAAAATNIKAAAQNTGDLSASVTRAAGSMKTGFDSVGGSVNEVTGSYEEAARVAGHLGSTSAGAAALMKSGFSDVAESAVEVGKASSEAAAGIGKIAESTSKVSNVAGGIDNLAKSIEDLGTGITTDVIADTIKKTEELKQRLSSIWEGSTAGAADVRNALLDIGSAAQTAGTAVADGAGKAADGLQNIPPVAAAAGDAIENSTQGAAGAVGELNEALQRLGEALASGSTEQIATSLGNVEKAARGVVEELKGGAAEGGEAIGGMIPPINLVEHALEELKHKAIEFGIAFVAAFTLDKFIEETSNLEHEQARLASALKSTGDVSGQTLESLNKHAEALKKVTEFTGGAITSAQALLLTFGNVRGDTFTKATDAILDMSAALGRDLTSSARAVGTALNDPINGIDNLRRMGVRFSEAQKIIIKDLVDTGHFAQAQTIILAELEKAYGGAAEAARNTLGGALTQVSKNLDEAFALGATAAGPLRDAIEGLAKVMASPEFKEAVQIIGTFMFKALELAAQVAIKTSGVIGVLTDHIKALAVVMAAVFGPAVFATIIGGFEAVAVAGVTAIGLIDAALLANPFGALIAGITAVITALYIFRDDIKAALGVDLIGIVEDTVNVIIGSFRACFIDIAFVVNNFPDIMAASATGAANAMIAAIEGAINILLPRIKEFYRALNPVAALADLTGNTALSTALGTGLLPDKVTIERMANEAADTLVSTIEKRNKDVENAMTTNYVGTFKEGVSRALSSPVIPREAELPVVSGKVAEPGDPAAIRFFQSLTKDAGAGLGDLTAGMQQFGETTVGTMRGVNDNFRQFNQGLVGTHHNLIDMRDAETQSNYAIIAQLQAYREQLRTVNMELELAQQTIKEGVSPDLAGRLFPGIKPEQVAALRDATEKIKTLFEELRNGARSPQAVAQAIAVLQTQLEQLGLNPNQVRNFLATFVGAQRESDLAKIKVKQLDDAIDQLEGKTIFIDVVTRRKNVPATDPTTGAPTGGTTPVGISSLGGGSEPSTSRYGVPSQGGGTGQVTVTRFASTDLNQLTGGLSSVGNSVTQGTGGTTTAVNDNTGAVTRGTGGTTGAVNDLNSSMSSGFANLGRSIGNAVQAASGGGGGGGGGYGGATTTPGGQTITPGGGPGGRTRVTGWDSNSPLSPGDYTTDQLRAASENRSSFGSWAGRRLTFGGFRPAGSSGTSGTSETRSPGDPLYGSNAPAGTQQPVPTIQGGEIHITNNFSVSAPHGSAQSLAETQQKLSASVTNAARTAWGR